MAAARSTTRTKKTAGAKKVAKSKARASRPTLASIAAQLESLTADVAALSELLREKSSARRVTVKPAATKAAKRAKPDTSSFDSDLLGIVGDLDRRGRHAGMVPIPEVRDVFLGKGWTRSSFDEHLLEAERAFVVDLKSANDPRRLEDPRQAIEQPGRGHLQYVVIR